jgi:hypothetical protein
MTGDATASPEQLPGLSLRAGGPPVWTGDYFNGQRIVGFTLARDPGPAVMVLVDGDEVLTVPPNRPLPAPGDWAASIQRTGPSPVDDLADGRLHEASRELSDGLDRHLSALGEKGDFIRELLGSIAAEGHLAWLVGGAVRDLISVGAQTHPADLDFTGTMGPSELHGVTRRWRRAAGASDCRLFISPRLVWAAAPPGGNRPDAFVEYKPLSHPGFGFPAWGGTLALDATTRDLTFNALYYDLQQTVADPTGRAMQDLKATPRTAFTPYLGDDPVEQATVLLRCLKFRLRWPDLNVEAIAEWAGGLPVNLVSRIPRDGWEFLKGLHGRCIPQRTPEADEFAAAKEIGPVAVCLVEEIHARRKAGA